MLQAIPFCDASARVTAGLKCAPEIGPNVRISATSAAPVAIVLASSAIASLPPASLSAMMPEPTTVASSIAVPSASERARRPGEETMEYVELVRGTWYVEDMTIAPAYQ